MKKFIASGFGVGLLWELLFKDKKEVGQTKGANIQSVAELIKPYC